MTAAVSLQGVSRFFGDIRAVDDVSIDIAEGEFFTMLGPSGSGKTTCLRLIAGFEIPDSGSIEIMGSNVNLIPPYRRHVNTVFQDYALFPHLSVIENVAYSLRIKKVGKRQRQADAQKLLELVQLPDHSHRKPHELSGGQRQRVALARALINKPKVLLLDEPLGALDLKLREEMQEELKTLQRSLGITFVFVTHDQNEALSLADRVAVFNEGRIAQVGTAESVYRQPATPFVADFVGSSNVLSPESLQQLLPDNQTNTSTQRWASLRPEDIRLVDNGGHHCTVTAKSYMGGTTRLTLQLNGMSLTSIQPSGSPLPQVGDSIQVVWQASDLHMMESG